MKKFTLIIFTLLLLTVVSCSKETAIVDTLEGKWLATNIYNSYGDDLVSMEEIKCYFTNPEEYKIYYTFKNVKDNKGTLIVGIPDVVYGSDYNHPYPGTIIGERKRNFLFELTNDGKSVVLIDVGEDYAYVEEGFIDENRYNIISISDNNIVLELEVSSESTLHNPIFFKEKMILKKL